MALESVEMEQDVWVAMVEEMVVPDRMPNDVKIIGNMIFRIKFYTFRNIFP